MNVYDFDHTIYDGDSTIDFYLFCLKKQPHIIRVLDVQILGFLRYLARKNDKNQWKESFFSFLPYLRNREQLLSAFWELEENKIKRWYMEQKCTEDVIISASPEFLLFPVKSYLGISDVIGTRMDFETGKIEGRNCRAEEKVIRFREKYQEGSIDDFYSDSDSDLPLAAVAKRAYKVRGSKIEPWNCKKRLKYRMLIAYLFFGICTTVINIISYTIFKREFLFSTVISTVMAWILAVIFAYVTNKKFVFRSVSWESRVVAKEAGSFFLCRIFSGGLDLIIMFLAVDVLKFYDVGVKIFTNLLVIVVNYVASKMIIFK